MGWRHGRAGRFQPADPARSSPRSCYQCHGPDQNKRKADLRLDLREGLFRSADGTTIVVPGKPEESELLARIASDDPELRMPPPKHAARLNAGADRTDQTLDRGRGRVEGALGVYSARRGRETPELTPERRDHGEIDRFIRAGLAANGLEPSPRADRRTLIRRLSFDLIGLAAGAERGRRRS